MPEIQTKDKLITLEELGVAINNKAGVTSVNNQTGAVSVTPANIGAVNKTGDTMTGDLTLSANDGTVILHPYWDSTNGQSLGFYIYAKNSGELNAIFLPLVVDNTGGHNIRLLSDLEPVKVTQGGTGATTAAGARNNIGIHAIHTVLQTDSNGKFIISFQNAGVTSVPAVCLLQEAGINDIRIKFYRAESESSSAIVCRAFWASTGEVVQTGMIDVHGIIIE